MALLISDGYTLDFAISASGPWPALRGRYRPALAEDVYDYTRQVRESRDGKAHLRAIVSLLSRQLVSWDVLDDKGEPVPITPKNLERVPHAVLDKLLDHVTGYGAAQEAGDVKNS